MNKKFHTRQGCSLWRVLLTAALAGFSLVACAPPTEVETPIPPGEAETTVAPGEVESTPVEETVTRPELCDMFMFDDLQPDETYVVGDVIASQGFEFVVQKFLWSNGTATVDGQARVEDHGGDIGLFTNNVNLNFSLSGPIDGMTLLVEYYGGNSNITINGDFRNFAPPSDIDGDVIGGVSVSVSDLGNSAWLIEFAGVIEEFSIGGQELWIGDVCFGAGPPPSETPPMGECAGFESLAVGTQYQVGDTFSDMGISFTVAPFTWGSGTPYGGGYAEVTSDGRAGGSGQELWTNNVNIDFNFGTPIGGLTMLFGAYGGNLNIEINGDFVNFDDPSTITGTIGGVNVVTTNISTSGLWSLELSGPISTFAIGGQEFAIDDVCPVLK